MESSTQLSTMNAVTERVVIPVKGGVNDWKEQLKFLLQSLQRQPGHLRTRWGPWLDDAQKLELLTAWSDTQASGTWKRSRDYADAMSRFAPVLNGRPASHMLQFRPHIPQAIVNSPIVETLVFEDCREPEGRMREVVERVKTMPGCNGVASGFSLAGAGMGDDSSSSSRGGGGEEGGGDGGGGGRMFVAAIGWRSIEASRAANKDVYTGGMKTESHHVDYNFPVKSFGGL